MTAAPRRRAAKKEATVEEWKAVRVNQGNWLNIMVFISVLLQCLDIFFTFIVIALLTNNLEILKKVADTAAKPVITATEGFIHDDAKTEQKPRPPTVARPSLDVESSSSDSAGSAGISAEEVERNAAQTE